MYFGDLPDRLSNGTFCIYDDDYFSQSCAHKILHRYGSGTNGYLLAHLGGHLRPLRQEKSVDDLFNWCSRPRNGHWLHRRCHYIIIYRLGMVFLRIDIAINSIYLYNCMLKQRTH